MGLSTNGSKVIKSETSFSHLVNIKISMPGFSQASYDRIHGFDFEEIVSNIKKTVENLKASGVNPHNICIYAHKYKFNEDEIPLIAKFAENLGVSFIDGYAFFNSFILAEQYLENRLQKDILDQAQKDLYLIQPKKLLKQRPKDFSCNQYNYLILSHTGKMSLCCCASISSKDYELLDFDDYNNITLEEIYQKRINSDTCKKCRKLGIDYMVVNNQPGNYEKFF